MKLPRNRFLPRAAGAVALPAISRVARAAHYPTKPVHGIVPRSPDRATDMQAGGGILGEIQMEHIVLLGLVADGRPGEEIYGTHHSVHRGRTLPPSG
jgi:hypothetical protein